MELIFIGMVFGIGFYWMVEFATGHTVRQQERERILYVLERHIQVCNFEKVNGEECDVCFWASGVISEVKGGE